MKSRRFMILAVITIALCLAGVFIGSASAVNRSSGAGVAEALNTLTKSEQFNLSKLPAVGRLAQPDLQPGAFQPAAPDVLGAWDSQSISFPAVITASGGLHMWYTGAGPEGWAVGLAESPDGLTWTKDAGNPVLTPGGPGAWDDWFVGQADVIEDGGLYKMYYSGAGTPWQTGYASSPDGVNWTKLPDPVLPTGAPGEWDEMEAAGPTVLVDGGVYKMWYHGCDPAYAACQIGYATSNNGINWTKHGPSVLAGTPGEWDESGLAWPRVIKNGATYEMWYIANQAVGYATSPDGITWTKSAANPVLTTGWDGAPAIVGDVLYEGGQYSMWLRSGVDATFGIGIATSPDGATWTMYPGNPLITPGAAGLVLHVNTRDDTLYAATEPTTTVTMTVTDGGGGIKATLVGMTDPNGELGSWYDPGAWAPAQPDILPGDIVTATTAAQLTEVNPVGEIGGVANADTNLVTGTVYAPWLGPTVDVSCEVWTWGGPTVDVPGVNADNGSFTCDFNGVYDIQPDQTIGLVYHEGDGDRVFYPVQATTLELRLRVNYGHDWVEGNYPSGYTIWITLTEPDGVTVKATAELQSGLVPWWGGQTGFSTSSQDWMPFPPDLLPGDWVFAQSSAGTSAAVQIGTIAGALDLNADTVAGTIFAPVAEPEIPARCEVWEDGGPGLDLTLDPNGGSYFCDFSLAGWDLQPTDQVAVSYGTPDGQWVINMFETPTPNMRVEKWPSGSGQTAPGSPAIYNIRVANDGNGVAAPVLVTDTLPAGTIYLGDTNPYGWMMTTTHTVVWGFPEIDPGEEIIFRLFLGHASGPGTVLTNQVDVYTDWDDDPGNNHAEADVMVVDGQPDLWVNKHADPGNPAPGETFLYNLDYGNIGPVASGTAVLTDTLPEGTSVVAWSEENEAAGWYLVYSDTQKIAFETQGLPGNWGGRLVLRLLLDPTVAPGTQLTNTVEITTTGDANPADNWYQDTNVWSDEPRPDAYVDKWTNAGMLVPGGFANFGIHVKNQGNVAAHLILTDTMPAGVEFQEAWRWDGVTNIPFPPTANQDGVLIWDFGVLEPGRWYNLDYRTEIDPGVAVGSELVNCAEVGLDVPDTQPWTNRECVSEIVGEPGVNLRVWKDYQWNGHGQVTYHLALQNIGSVPVPGAWVTDTLPAGMTLTGWWHDFHGPVIEHLLPAQNAVAFEIQDQINPGDWVWIHINVDLDPGLVGAEGLTFINSATAPYPDDVNPVDNTFELVSRTGPDGYIKKWLSRGEPRPGETVTFTVEFGNLNPSPWDTDPNFGSHITETLPAGMTFQSATGAWDATQVWDPEYQEGGMARFGWGPLWGGARWQFDVTVLLSDTLEGGDVLVNTIEVFGDNPDQFDFDLANNTFTLPVTVLAPKYAVSKAYEGAPVAGGLITYTVTVANTGTLAGTQVTLSDTLPAGFTFEDTDGALAGSEVSWTLPSLAAGAEAGGWVSGRLTCTAAIAVINDEYQVMSSQEGVTSPLGAPVSLMTLPPTITADLGWSGELAAGKPIDFSALTSTNGSVLTYEWDFDDGGTATGATASHTFALGGAYTVTLTVTDACGFTAEKVVEIEVAGYPLYLPALMRPE